MSLSRHYPGVRDLISLIGLVRPYRDFAGVVFLDLSVLPKPLQPRRGPVNATPRQSPTG